MKHDIRQLARTTIGVLACASFIASGVVAARGVEPGTPVIALAFDADTHTVIKADQHALYRRDDDGGKWQALRLPDTPRQSRVSAVAISPRALHMLYVAGPGLGVLRSSDFGTSWIAKSDGLPSRDVVALAVHADQAATVYAYIRGKGIFRSDDAGDHWRLMDAGPRDGIVQFVHSNMPGSMQTGWLFAATVKGVARSMDCFCGWRDAGALRRPAASVAFDRDDPKRVYAATRDGLFVSADGGEQWARVGSPGRVSALVSAPGGVLIGANDQGALIRSTNYGLTWQRIDG
ncbi:MAG TPA: hypothetical protein VGA51_20960 [Casimicrobiaceae bacterium]